MKEYLIILKNTMTMNNLRNGGFTNAGTLSFGGVHTKTFPTYEDALAFANTLDYGVTIYEAVAKTEIMHVETKLNEHSDDTTRKQNRISRPSS